MHWKTSIALCTFQIKVHLSLSTQNSRTLWDACLLFKSLYCFTITIWKEWEGVESEVADCIFCIWLCLCSPPFVTFFSEYLYFYKTGKYFRYRYRYINTFTLNWLYYFYLTFLHLLFGYLFTLFCFFQLVEKNNWPKVKGKYKEKQAKNKEYYYECLDKQKAVTPQIKTE